MAISVLARAQGGLILTTATEYNQSFSPSAETAILLGVKGLTGSSLSVGIGYRRYLTEITHNPNYITYKMVGSVKLLNNFGANLQTMMLNGQYYNQSTSGEICVCERSKLFGSVGFYYYLTKNAQIYTDIAIRDYNPNNLYKRERSPYDPGAVKFGFSYQFNLTDLY